MAKKSAFAPPKPLYVDGGYTGILFFTLVAIAFGIGMLVWEIEDDYAGETDASKAPQAQTVKSLVDAERKSSTPAPAPGGN